MNKITFYTVIESQIGQDGVAGILTYNFDDKNMADSKYHAILSVAAVSDIPYHAAFIIRSDGVNTEGMVYDRRVNPIEAEE